MNINLIEAGLNDWRSEISSAKVVDEAAAVNIDTHTYFVNDWFKNMKMNLGENYDVRAKKLLGIDRKEKIVDNREAPRCFKNTKRLPVNYN